MDAQTQIQYGSDPAQWLDLFYPLHTATDASTSSPPKTSASKPLIVYIHGGAWRAGDASEARGTLAPALVARLGLPFASVNYRLAPAFKHPAQADDVISALTFLRNRKDAAYDSDKVVLVGHSCGAFIAASIVLRPDAPVTTVVEVPQDVRSSIRGVACFELLGDLSTLLEEYPNYADFVQGAFGLDTKVYDAESPARWTSPSDAAFVHFLILHSREDELLTLRQPEMLAKCLALAVEPAAALKAELVPHQVSEKGDQAPEKMVRGAKGTVEVDFESLKGAHHAVVHTAALVESLETWIRKVFADVFQ